ncbi:hypothetical protein WA588_002257 [Blastocystis sp. NMH]
MRSQSSDTSGHSLANCKACRQCGRSKPIQAYISKNKAFICLICDTCRMNQRKKSRQYSRIRKMQKAINNTERSDVDSDGWIYRPISVNKNINLFFKSTQGGDAISSIIDSVIPTARWIPSTLSLMEADQSLPVVATVVSHCTLLSNSRN